MDEADNFKFNKYRGSDAYWPRVVFKPIVFVHKNILKTDLNRK